MRERAAAPAPTGGPSSPELPARVPGCPRQPGRPPASPPGLGAPLSARRERRRGPSSRRDPAAAAGGSTRPGPTPLLRDAGAAGSCSSPARPPSCCGTARWGAKNYRAGKKDGGDCLPPLPSNSFRSCSIFALAGSWKSISQPIFAQSGRAGCHKQKLAIPKRRRSAQPAEKTTIPGIHRATALCTAPPAAGRGMLGHVVSPPPLRVLRK